MTLVWKEPSKDFRLFTAEVKGGLEASSLRDAFADAWRFMFNTVVPLNSKEEWDHVRFEFWLDSGRCEIFVAHSDRVERIARGGCRLVSHALMSVWDRCATDYRHSDDEFLSALVGEEKKFTTLAVEAADFVARENEMLRGIEVVFWNADSEHLDTFVISTK